MATSILPSTLNSNLGADLTLLSILFLLKMEPEMYFHLFKKLKTRVEPLEKQLFPDSARV